MLRTLVLALLACLTVACGPVYETTYTYKNPVSFVGKRCVNQCLWQKNRCKARNENRRSRCINRINDENSRRDHDYQRCTRRAHEQFLSEDYRANRRNRHNRRNKWNKNHPNAQQEQRRFNPRDYGCERNHQNTNECRFSAGCEAAYKSCFENCGGIIIPHTQCVAFCKKT